MNHNLDRYRSPLLSPLLGVEPFNPFPGRRGLIDNMFDTGFSFSGLADLFDSDFGVKVVDKKDRKEYQFGLPGVTKEDIDVDVSGNVLSIQVSQKDEDSVRSYSSKVTLAPNLDLSQAHAESVNGLLTVSFPYLKKETFKIEVTSGDEEEGKIIGSSSDGEKSKEVEGSETTDSRTSDLSLDGTPERQPQEHQI